MHRSRMRTSIAVVFSVQISEFIRHLLITCLPRVPFSMDVRADTVVEIGLNCVEYFLDTLGFCSSAFRFGCFLGAFRFAFAFAFIFVVNASAFFWTQIEITLIQIPGISFSLMAAPCLQVPYANFRAALPVACLSCALRLLMFFVRRDFADRLARLRDNRHRSLSH